jgi:hypothetical protein
MAGHVYVSYDGHDVGYVRRLVDHLAASWLTVWVDQEAESGEHWHPDLEAAIRSASVLLVIMSPASQNSDRVRGEITYAHSIGKPIIPMLLAGRAFFSQGGNAPENVIGGALPDDALIERLGDLSQTPITHRRSGKPGRGSSSRERDSTTTTGTALIAPMSAPSGPPGFGPPRSGGPAYGGSPNDGPAYGGPGSGGPAYGGPAYGGPGSGGFGRPGQGGGPYPPPPATGPRRYQPDDDYEDDDDHERRRFRPAILFGAAAVVMLVVGILTVVLLSGSGSSKPPSTPVGATNPRTTVATPSGSSAAFEGPTLTAGPSTSTSKKPTTTTTKPATTTTTVTTVTTTDPPPIPNVTLSIDKAALVLDGINDKATVTITFSPLYPTALPVDISSSSGAVGVPPSVSVPASGSMTFTVTGLAAGNATVTASVSGHFGHVDVAVSDPP